MSFSDVFLFCAALLLGVVDARYLATHLPDPKPACIDAYADTEAGWQKLYQKHNREYFGGRLRKARVLSSEDPVRFGDLADTFWAGEEPTIKIAPSRMATLNAAELVLFHEQCHVEGGPPKDGVDSHGPRWKGCMRRLALSGAFEDLW